MPTFVQRREKKFCVVYKPSDLCRIIEGIELFSHTIELTAAAAVSSGISRWQFKNIRRPKRQMLASSADKHSSAPSSLFAIQRGCS
mmetsp:Transcript_2305/g.3223  ORF Transcript_2305/g.3223 Transcript_2305/m.3223 type:complete len:86 (+) Transcript_2305:816-1073(+)